MIAYLSDTATAEDVSAFTAKDYANSVIVMDAFTHHDPLNAMNLIASLKDATDLRAVLESQP
jgi:hypothetical protein